MEFLVVAVVGIAVGAAMTGLLRARTSGSDPRGADAGMAREHHELRAAFESLPVGVIVADRDGHILLQNGLATSLGGPLHSDVLLDEAVETLLRAALDGDSRRQTLDLHGPPRRVVVVSARPLDQGGAMALVEDVTERARLDAVRTDFVANISHELRTPVGALAVLAETLADADEPEVADRLSRKMVDEAHRVARTIDDLLELSRIELGGAAVRELVDPSVVVADAVDRVRPFADRRGITIDARCLTTRAQVRGDRRQLVSALGNLLENAVKYSEGGQVVAVTADESGSHDDGSVGLVVFRVADEGVGIPDRDLGRVFERFYRVDRARSRETGGTGLGLAIVRHVATNHGGEVTVTSREGEGSIFELRIPADRHPGDQRSDQAGDERP